MRRAILLGTGTSQGVPVIGCTCMVCRSNDPRDHRLRTSLFLDLDGTSVVIDAGPDFRQQMLTHKIDKLDAVLITHEHNDHVAGLDDVRPFNFRQQCHMPIYATDYVMGQLVARYSYAFADNPYPGSPRMQLHKVDFDSPFRLGGMEVLPIRVEHGGVPVMGYRFGDLVYVTDAKSIAPEELDKMRGARYLILNALRIHPHYSHLHLEEAIALATSLDVEQTWFTHISHDMGPYEQVSKMLPGGFQLGYDGLEIAW
jgi:phosphoribosyl 1,2-cyclic phosphate phosphodiesterase